MKQKTIHQALFVKNNHLYKNWKADHTENTVDCRLKNDFLWRVTLMKKKEKDKKIKIRSLTYFLTIIYFNQINFGPLLKSKNNQ